MKPHIALAHHYWKTHLKPNDVAWDMTCGNGHDTLALHSLGATIYGFDIQETAIKNTLEKVPTATLFLRSHDDLPPLPTPRLIVYNLGYLPGSDKSITTNTSTTLRSLDLAIQTLAPDGALSITCYPGHPEGAREEKAILEWAKTLPKQVCYHQWITREKSPSLLLIT
jgi:hypothetical protein